MTFREIFNVTFLAIHSMKSRVAQWKRAGPITQRSEDQNLALLNSFLLRSLLERRVWMREFLYPSVLFSFCFSFL